MSGTRSPSTSTPNVLHPATGFGSKPMSSAPLKLLCSEVQGPSLGQVVLNVAKVHLFPEPLGRRIETLPRPEKSPICIPLLATPDSFAGIKANGSLPPRVFL